MYSEGDIDDAVRAGAITPAAAAAFRAHVASAHAAPAVDEEHFRLLTGFNDVFVSIAIVLLLAAVAQIGAKIGYAFGGVFVAGTAWALAEFFTARRRMALPSILLLIAFVGGVMGAGVGLMMATGPYGDPRTCALIAAGIAALGGVAAAGHWRRFHVPITVAAGTAAIVGVGVALVLAIVPEIGRWLYPLLLIAGIAVFAVAMRWDMSDPDRITRRADVAFWLHLVAAPLIAHSVFNLLGVFGNAIGVGIALVVLLLYLAFGFVALAVDRRALLVSSLVYVLYAMYALFRSAGAIELGAALTAFVIGSALLTLSAFWHPIRRIVVGTIGGWAVRLPPVQRAAA